MKEAYVQFLDFKAIKKAMKKQETENKKSGKDPLDDLDEISEEVREFFNAVLNAESTSDLDAYTDELLEDADRLLTGSSQILGYIENSLEDKTILNYRNRKNLQDAMKKRTLLTARRIL